MPDPVGAAIADILLSQIAQAQIVSSDLAFKADKGPDTGCPRLSIGLGGAERHEQFGVSRQRPAIVTLSQRDRCPDALAKSPMPTGQPRRPPEHMTRARIPCRLS